MEAVVVVVFACAIASDVRATVTQVDGTIIPESNRLQDELDDAGETLDAVLDAAERPEVFLPNLGAPVVFADIAEGAGFENSFGYYNVGDDVFTAAGRAQNLHPIMGCGVPMENHAYNPAHTGHHHGNPADYFEDAEPGDSITVDFADELAAGRYKGGFIGFYLIAPEGRGSEPNCGDFQGASYFGFIYYTQKDLNDDGDFVHHLVYQSDLAPDRFYFGFEDLFRGGDNDFEDMLMRVDGLTPPCTPTAEICDGLDNDCDDIVDELDPDLVGTGDPCVCDGGAMPCVGGPRAGECLPGVTICTGGGLQCESTVAPTAEICDGLDNNCNNLVDDNPSGVGDPCDGPDSDLCPEGVTECTGGAITCSDTTGPNIELCNGLDDDCDTLFDEDPADVGGSCGSDVGECSPGVIICDMGAPVCDGEVTGTDEVCDGLDNNCNGISDDDPTDVGVTCGTTDMGVCEFGETICNAGVIECVGEIGPIPEICDLMDNDCDGVVDNDPIDVGNPCGSGVGVCEPGVIICTAMGPACDGETGGVAEECNGIDDDCNGIIDDDPAGEGAPCGDEVGACELGELQCIDGSLQCVGGYTGGTETCNGIDDDCDGTVDEGDLCDGGVCGDGVCSAPCAGGEFDCPPGQVCEMGFCVDDPCFGIDCPLGPAGELGICIEGVCTPVCDTVSCPDELVCRDTDGACVPDNCTFLPLCEDDELCVGGVCVANPCAGVSCGAAEFCRGGDCIPSCGGVVCPGAQVCIEGACVPTGCPEPCRDGQVCDTDAATCVPDPCRFTNCGPGLACDPQTGMCIDDPCLGVVCPGDEVCELGNCYDEDHGQQPGAPDAGDRTYVFAGGGGCSTTSHAASLWLALGLLALLRRRLALVLVLALTLSGCGFDPFCLDCGDPGATGDGGMVVTPDAGPDARPPDAGPGCDAGVVHQETCDGADNDCDGDIDEDFDFEDDRNNCGGCGVVCDKPGARTECADAMCAITGCFPGKVDLDDDIDGPYDESTGCEYSCFVSNMGVEACDGLDNDCDGDTDEDTDFQNDDNNCGECGRVCNYFKADPHCELGVCVFDPLTDCDPGFHDLDMDQTTGCEYACSATGAETCNLRDDDCDGAVDEDFALATNPLHCGQCNRVCSFPHATPSCVAGTCTFDPATDCDPGFHDVNGNPADGCEYPCTPSGVEVCDLMDNDCNGAVDDMTTDSGGACNAAPGGVATGACVDDGTIVCSLGALVCSGATQPTVETCNSVNDDCDTMTDEVFAACYTGPAGTQGVGVCRGGAQACVGGMFTGPCIGQVTPAALESCNSLDDDCDGDLDEAAGGGPLVESCYDGTPGTAGRGTCVAGTHTCTFGAFGACTGQVVDTIDLCGDGLDTDCDDLDDAAEGCPGVEAAEIRVDQPGSGAGEDHSFDVHVAAGGIPSGVRLYAVWADLRNGDADIYFRRSTDGGGTWGGVTNLTASVGDAAVKPMIVVAPGLMSDRVYVVYQTVTGSLVRDIRVQVSADSGATFGAASGALDATGDSFHHHAAVSEDGMTLAVVWEQLDTSTLARTIVSRVSTDGGGSFAAARTINVGSGGAPIAGRPQVGVTASERLVWVWREKRGGATPDVFAAFSDSPTAAIAGDQRLDGDGGDTRESDFPRLAVAGELVAVVWQDISTIPGGGADVVFTRSTNGGAAWSAERVLDDPAAEVSSSFSPALAIEAAAGRIYTVWQDRREGTQIYAAVSADSGATFAAARRVSSVGGAPATGVIRDPMIAIAGTGAAVVGYTNDDGTEIERIYAASTIDGGASWSFTHTRLDLGADTRKALQPVLAPAFGSGLAVAAVVVWLDFRSGTGVNGDVYARRVGT